MTSYAVYADFNCPFCYALGERLGENHLDQDIEWRPIQHVASQVKRCSVGDLAELAADVFTVRHQAPEISIAMPQHRPNTRMASNAFLALQEDNHSAALRFRSLIYRALWVEDKDISDPGVIVQILKQTGVEGFTQDTSDSEKLYQWQHEWEYGNFDKRIPTMVASDGRSLPGLASPQDIQSFLQGKSPIGASSGVCEFVARPLILLVGEPRDVWPLVSCLRHENDVLVAENSKFAIRQISSDLVPDLILLPAGFEADAEQICRDFQKKPEALDVPVMVVDGTPDTERQIGFLELGASEYLPFLSEQRLFKARARLQIAGKARRDLLQRRGCEDALTGIPNRRELERVIELEWRRGIRSKLPLSVLLLDIDHFKQFNDLYGHQKGDVTLASVAKSFSGTLRRNSDLVARYGGEEFAVVLTDCNATYAQKAAQACLHAVEALAIPHANSPYALVTVSVGCATTVPTQEASLSGFFELVDQCLYQAKAKGRNKVVSSPIDVS